MTTGHNAIAIQSYNGNSPDYGEVVITGNKFLGIGDRIIRFGNIGSDTQITITGNFSENSGDKQSDGRVEVIKAGTIAGGVTYKIENNTDWIHDDVNDASCANLIYILNQ